jgi:hypothetical protein
MILLLLIGAVWSVLLLLIAGLCAAARLGDAQAAFEAARLVLAREALDSSGAPRAGRTDGVKAGRSEQTPAELAA